MTKTKKTMKGPKKPLDSIIKFKRLTSSDIIQIAVLGILLCTVYLTSINIRQQGEFNRYAFRPWLYVEPRKTIEIQENRIIFWYDLRCEGASPAYHISRHEEITSDSTFPKKATKKTTLQTTRSIGLIEPGTTREIDEYCLINIPQQVSSNPLLSITNKKLFFHIYVVYKDFKNNHYGLECTILPENLSEFAPNQYTCGWSIINVNDECFK